MTTSIEVVATSFLVYALATCIAVAILLALQAMSIAALHGSVHCSNAWQPPL
jgi:hypothetical protein